jgi:hypothetical protein
MGNETYEDQLEKEREGEQWDPASVCIGSAAIIKWVRNQKEPESRDWWWKWLGAINFSFSELGIDPENVGKYFKIGVGLANDTESYLRHSLVKQFCYFEDSENLGILLVNLQAFVEIERQYTEPAYVEHQEMIDTIFEAEFDESSEKIEEIKKLAEIMVTKARELGLDDFKAPPPASVPKQKKKRKKKQKYGKIENMLGTMALVAVYVAGSDRKSDEDPIDDKEKEVALDVSRQMFSSLEWQDRLFFRDLTPEEMEKTTQGCEPMMLDFVDIGNDRERLFDELEEQVLLLREQYSYTEDKDWDNWDREKSNNTQFMVHFATNVANASGGLLGFGKISKKEREAITSIYKILDPDDTLYEKNVEYRIDEMVKMIKNGECTY